MTVWKTYLAGLLIMTILGFKPTLEKSVDISDWKERDWNPIKRVKFVLIFQNGTVVSGGYHDLKYWTDETGPLKDVKGFVHRVRADKSDFDDWVDSMLPFKGTSEEELKIASKQWQMIENWFALANITLSADHTIPI